MARPRTTVEITKDAIPGILKEAKAGVSAKELAAVNNYSYPEVLQVLKIHGITMKKGRRPNFTRERPSSFD